MLGYSNKEIITQNKMLFSFGKKQKVTARSIVMHPDLDLMFVSDMKSRAIQVYTQSGDHVTTHTHSPSEYFAPWGMTYKNGTLYVVSSNRILSFNDFTVWAHDRWGDRQVILSTPRGLSCDEQSNLYVADKGNDRICVFDKELKLLRTLAQREIAKPRDVQVVGEELAVLTEEAPFLIVFSLKGEVLRTLNALEQFCIEPWFFFIDEEWNILISDYDLYCCSSFKKTGELKERLFKPQFDLNHSTQLVSVFGISLTAEKKIIICTSSREHPFCIFLNS